MLHFSRIRVDNIPKWDKMRVIDVRIITKKRLHDFWALHPDAESSLERWHQLVSQNTFLHFANLRETFPDADQVGRVTVFNISGNKYRLIAAIHYNTQLFYVLEVLTHAEYSRNEWQQRLDIFTRA